MGEKSASIVFPHHLFREHPAIQRASKFFMVEDQLFFGDPKFKIRFHKNKIVLQRASMKYYYDYLNSRGLSVEYIEYEKDPKMRYISDTIESYDRVYCAELIDHELSKRMNELTREMGIDLIELEGPSFLVSRKLLDEYFGDERYLLTSFYIKERKRLGVLMEGSRPIGGKWTFDRDNRRRVPHGMRIPQPIRLDENPYVSEAKFYVEDVFPDNPGSTSNFNYPTTHREAGLFLDDFIKNRFSNFGSYQDFIARDNTFLFHSILSSSLNTGLVTPSEVLKAALSVKVPINSMEGFIRQIIGWREFVRGVYIKKGPLERSKNFFKHTRRLNDRMYYGKTGIEPYDVAVGRVLNHAYTHHIERLMVIGNFMLLTGIHPDEVYRWFMEMFIDSYDWVMVPNVYGMSQYADGGLMATKPYISSSNYILRMSDFKRGKWCGVWDALFWTFLDEKRAHLENNPRIKVIYRHLTENKLEGFRKIRDEFLNSIFNG